MVASQPAYGPSFGLFSNIRLLTATMLNGFVELEPGTAEYANVFAMGMLLLITVITVFLAMKKAEKAFDPVQIAKKESKAIRKENRIRDIERTKGLGALSIYEQKQFFKYRKRKAYFHSLREQQTKEYEREKVIRYSNVKTIEAKSKKYKSFGQLAITTTLSMVGVFTLAAIM